MLCLLRIGNGWLFLYEGLTKHNDPHFSAEPFLAQAKGPLAPQFLALLPDADGRKRLAKEDPNNPGTFHASPDRVIEVWRDYVIILKDRFDALHERQVQRPGAKEPDDPQQPGKYKFTSQQYEQAMVCFEDHAGQLRDFFSAHQEEIQGYLDDLKRLEQQEADTTIRDAAFAQQRAVQRRRELAAQAAPWLAQIDRLSESFRSQLWQLLREDQQAAGLPDAPLQPVDDTSLARINTLLPYGLMAIGGLLMVGLLTPVAGLAGAAFLLLVVLSQPAWPTIYPPPHPSAGNSLLINKEVVQMLSLLVLAATCAGRWGGLDFFLASLWRRCCGCGAKKSDSSAA